MKKQKTITVHVCDSCKKEDELIKKCGKCKGEFCDEHYSTVFLKSPLILCLSCQSKTTVAELLLVNTLQKRKKLKISPGDGEKYEVKKEYDDDDEDEEDDDDEITIKGGDIK